MRFQQRPRCPYTVTDRKRAAARRWQQRQRDALPLLGELIAEQQPSIDQIMSERVERWDDSERTDRARRATLWREGRRRIDAHPDEIRRALLAYWNNHRWLPGDPSYLLDMLHGFKNGRLIFADGAIRPARITIAVSEATAMERGRKPISGGWLGKRA
jgi:hypothetical protein